MYFDRWATDDVDDEDGAGGGGGIENDLLVVDGLGAPGLVVERDLGGGGDDGRCISRRGRGGSSDDGVRRAAASRGCSGWSATVRGSPCRRDYAGYLDARRPSIDWGAFVYQGQNVYQSDL